MAHLFEPLTLRGVDFAEPDWGFRADVCQYSAEDGDGQRLALRPPGDRARFGGSGVGDGGKRPRVEAIGPNLS